MQIMSIDDFDFWVDSEVAESRLVFSPLFVYILLWARRTNNLSVEYKEDKSFVSAIDELEVGKISFSTFVMDVLDGVLLSEYFCKEVEKFVVDYFEYDGVMEDLQAEYNVMPIYFPHNLEKLEQIIERIEGSRINYFKNKASKPELVSFDKENWNV